MDFFTRTHASGVSRVLAARCGRGLLATRTDHVDPHQVRITGDPDVVDLAYRHLMRLGYTPQRCAPTELITGGRVRTF